MGNGEWVMGNGEWVMGNSFRYQACSLPSWLPNWSLVTSLNLSSNDICDLLQLRLS
jgi:hypothetical protein